MILKSSQKLLEIPEKTNPKAKTNQAFKAIALSCRVDSDSWGKSGCNSQASIKSTKSVDWDKLSSVNYEDDVTSHHK